MRRGEIADRLRARGTTGGKVVKMFFDGMVGVMIFKYVNFWTYTYAFLS